MCVCVCVCIYRRGTGGGGGGIEDRGRNNTVSRFCSEIHFVSSHKRNRSMIQSTNQLEPVAQRKLNSYCIRVKPPNLSPPSTQPPPQPPPQLPCLAPIIFAIHRHQRSVLLGHTYMDPWVRHVGEYVWYIMRNNGCHLRLNKKTKFQDHVKISI